MKVSNWLSASAVTHPERPALVCGDQQLTYAELDRRVTEASRRLVGLELDVGDLVATTLSAGVDLVVLAHAAIRVGVVLAPIDPGLRAAERDALVASLDPTVVIDDAEQLDGAPLGPEPDGDALELERVLSVIHTSGSGGSPKPVALTFANHLWSAVGCGMRIGMSPEDRWLCCLPMHHIGGFAIPIRCAIYGATVLVEPFEADRTADTLAGGTTIVSLVATMLDRLLDRGQGLGELRCALLGGGPAPAALIERAIEAGAPLAPTYGMTEACSQVTTLLPEELLDHRGSSGRPIPSTRLRIDEDGRILVAGPTVAPSESDAGGWLRTGDLGALDEGGPQGRERSALVGDVPQGDGVPVEPVGRLGRSTTLVTVLLLGFGLVAVAVAAAAACRSEQGEHEQSRQQSKPPVLDQHWFPSSSVTRTVAAPRNGLYAMKLGW